MGICGSRDDFDDKHLDKIPEVEKNIYKEEKEFSISKSSYLKYREAVKKVGADLLS